LIKTSTKIIFSLLIILGFSACQKPPEYDNTPFISQAADTEYIDVDAFDTLRIHLNFKDGDGDLGLEIDGDTLSPYQAYDILNDAGGNPIRIQDGEIFNINHFTDDNDVDNDGINDTVKIKINLFKDNMLFDFVRINQLGEIIDTLNFDNLNGGLGIQIPNFRFEPLYKKDFSEDVYEGPLDGTIDAEIVSSFSKLPKGTYRINVKIVDRALNVSNEILTTPSIVIK